MIGDQSRPALGIFVPEFPGQTHGFFWREMSLLQQLGFRVEILSTRLPPLAARARHEWADKARARTAHLTPIGVSGSAGMLLESFRSIGRWNMLARMVLGLKAGSAASYVRHIGLAAIALRLRKMCRDLNVCHLHVHSCADSALLAAMCQRAGGPSYSLVLHSPIDCFGENQRHKWGSADFGVVVSRYVGDELSKRYGDALPHEILVSPMGFDETIFKRDTPYRSWTPGSPLRLAACSRVSKGKGIDTLIELVSGLVGEGVDAQLQVAGGCDSDGSGVLDDLRRLACRLGVAGRVMFLGGCSAGRVRELLSESHVFVTATRQEAIGVAIMEAMAMELPVVATRVGGIPELVEDGRSGELVPVDSPQAMLSAVLSVVQQEGRAKAVGRAALQRVGREFTSSRSVSRLADVLTRRCPRLLAGR